MQSPIPLCNAGRPFRQPGRQQVLPELLQTFNAMVERNDRRNGRRMTLSSAISVGHFVKLDDTRPSPAGTALNLAAQKAMGYGLPGCPGKGRGELLGFGACSGK